MPVIPFSEEGMKPVADLSVLMPTYNHSRYLRRALDAIVNQSVQPKELIVIDDCSTDETPAILAEYARTYSYFQSHRNETNQGVNRSVHRAFALATGGYTFFAGSDDCILPGFVEKSMALLARHPQAGLCCSYHATVDGTTGAISENPSQWCEQPRYFTPAEAERMLRRGSIAGHTSILKREAIAAAGIFLADLEWYADLFANQVVAFRHGFCHIPEKLALLTVMPGTYSAAPARDKQMRVLGALLQQLTLPEFADVAAAFRRSGCLWTFGAAILRAAARRPDVWSREILGLINGLDGNCYEESARDPDPVIRELAEFLWGPCVRDLVEQVRDRDETIRKLQVEVQRHHDTLMEACRMVQERDITIERANARLAAVEGSLFWKVRSFLARCKGALWGSFQKRKRPTD